MQIVADTSSSRNLPNNRTLDTLAARNRRWFEILREKRRPFEPHWNAISRFILPTSEHFEWHHTPGKPKDPRVVDSTGRIACQQLTSFVYTGITNPSQRWFELSLKFMKIRRLDNAGRTTIIDLGAKTEVQNYLKECSDIIYKAFQSPKTRFETANFETISSIVGLGTGCLYVGHEAGEAIRFQSIPLHELFLIENDRGEVDTVYRRFTYTVRQAVKRWGLDKLGPKLRAKFDANPFEEVQFLHIVHPSDESNFFGRAWGAHKYYSCYQCLTDDHILSESGYKHMPYIVARWIKNTNEVYGLSQSSLTLSDVQMVQRMHWNHLVMEEKMTNPVTLVMSNSDVQMDHRPGATIVGGMDSMGRPTVSQMSINGDMNAGLAMEEQVRSRIRAAYFMDRLSQMDDPRSTATEARIRQMEQIRQLAPANTRLEHEYAGPLVHRVYELLKAAGELPQEPEIIRGHDLIVEYSGPMSQAQRQVGADVLNQFIAQIQGAMQIDPEVAREFDWKLGARSTANLYPLFAGFTRDKRDVDAEREAEAEAQAQAAQSAQMQQGLNQMEQLAGMSEDLGGQ
jgi:hypothetical protein